MLFSYKMTHDTGFAPNPFYGYMTLANCKPLIRRLKQVGVFIAGFTSGKLCGDKVGEERLIYIMKITEKLSYKQYFNDVRFACKKPSNQNLITAAGDNIYAPANEGKNGYTQLKNKYHDCKNTDHDLSGNYVLISNDFYYFGCGAIPVDGFGINIPRVQSAHGVKTTELNRLWDYLKTTKTANTVLNNPHSWDENEPYNDAVNLEFCYNNKVEKRSHC